MDDEGIDERITSQYGFDEKRCELESVIRNDGHGNLWILDDPDDKDISYMFSAVMDYLGMDM
jgi:hypothetical protein